MAATATATVPNGMINPNGRPNLTQALAELASDLFPIGRPRTVMGAAANAAQFIGGHAGGVSQAERTMIAVVAGLKGKHAGAMNGQIQRAAELGAVAAKEAGHKGTLSEEQAQAISDQVMKGLEGKHLSAQVQEKVRFGKTKAAFIGTLGAASAVALGAVALAAKPLAWAGDKIMGTKMNESFSVRGALTKGFLAVAVTFSAAAAYDLHKRTSRNNARDAALVHAIQHGAQRQAQGGFVTRAAAAAAAAPQEPIVAPDAPKPDAPKQEQAVATTVAAATAAATVAARAPEGRVKDKGVPVNQFYQQVQRAIEQGNQMNKDQPAAGAPAAAPAATAEKVAAAIKPDFGIKSSYGTMAYGGDVKLGMGGAIPGKTPEIKGVKVEAKIG